VSLTIIEWFGFNVECRSQRALRHRRQERCPFLGATCTKSFNDGTRAGVCTVAMATDKSAIAICPNRLYADNYAVLQDVANCAFGKGCRVIRPHQYAQVKHQGNYVVAFGKNFGKELRLPTRQARGSYFVDWVLARITSDGGLDEFVAVEVQSIDTTGSYRKEVENLRSGMTQVAKSKAGLNWRTSISEYFHN